MRVNSVVRLAKGNASRGLAFGRNLREDEKRPYSETINKAMDFLLLI